MVAYSMSYQFPFTSVRTGKVSELIAQQIKSAMLSGLMRPGQKLSSERELGEQFEASRNSVREALKILEVSGLVSIKRGCGVFACEISSKPMSESFSAILKMKNISLNELTEARLAAEPGAARLACERVTEEDFQKLAENIEDTAATLRSCPTAPADNMKFHILIAEATHNAAVVLMMNTLFDVVKDMTLEIAATAPHGFGGSGQVLKHHKRILKAFRERNPQKAYDLMLGHILEVQEALKNWLRR